MRLLDRDRLAGLRLPVRRERLVELLVQLARRVVRHVEQGDLRVRRFGAQDADSERGEECLQAKRGP